MLELVVVRIGAEESPRKQDVAYRDVLKGDPCVYCGDRGRMVVDHIVPTSCGGEQGWTNMAAACSACNASKATRPMLRFVAGVQSGYGTDLWERADARRRLRWAVEGGYLANFIEREAA